jgi:LuxR family glucitol operon transcriptional activator
MALGYIKRGRLSLQEVIDHLYTASKSVKEVFDELFACMWDLMARDAQQVLLVIPFFADYASKQALGAASGLREYYLDKAVEELVVLNLLDIKEGAVVVSQHYSTHPLTRAFAAAQLREVPAFEEQARMRWRTYYLDFAAHHLVREQPRERYWNTLVIGSSNPIDPEWPNLKRVLAWADQKGQDQLVVELMLLLTHYMGWHFFFPERFYYARKAAEAADKLGRKEDAALFRMDALGWTLLESGQLEDAKREITAGLDIARDLKVSSAEAIDLITLASTFLARAFLEEGNLAQASAFIDNVVSLECRPVIQCRRDVVAGDIAYRQQNYTEAIRLYEKAHWIGQQYGSEGADIDLRYRLGNAHFANGNLEAAEAHFNLALAREQQYITHETSYAKYGLACIAQGKGERDKARQLALEALSDLSRSVSSHRLLSQVQDFLKSLEAE